MYCLHVSQRTTLYVILLELGSFIFIYLFFLRYLFTGLELSKYVRLTGRWAPVIFGVGVPGSTFQVHMPLWPCSLVFFFFLNMSSGHQIQILMLSRQALYWPLSSQPLLCCFIQGAWTSTDLRTPVVLGSDSLRHWETIKSTSTWSLEDYHCLPMKKSRLTLTLAKPHGRYIVAEMGLGPSSVPLCITMPSFGEEEGLGALLGNAISLCGAQAVHPEAYTWVRGSLFTT